MRQCLVMGNWKMNGCLTTVDSLLNEIQSQLTETQQSQCVVFPPTIYLQETSALLHKTAIKWGAQNVYPADAGAFTGEISSLMLKDFQCRYVLVGHSERRHILGEDENFVAKKFHHVKVHDMIPVLCVGETLAQREQGLTHEIIASQLKAVMDNSKHAFEAAVIAYEPVWAIGTGQTASAEQAQAVHAFIRQLIAQYEPQSADKVPIVYGGSVNERNAYELFAMPDVDGGLVGGASLNARQFVEIVKCIS
jgi:triosephosphate isomerase